MTKHTEGDKVDVMIEVEVLEAFPDGDLWVEADGVEFMVEAREVV